MFSALSPLKNWPQSGQSWHSSLIIAKTKLSVDLCQQAIGLLDAGGTPQQLASTFCVNVTTVYCPKHRFMPPTILDDLLRCGSQTVTTTAQNCRFRRHYYRDNRETTANTSRHTIGMHGRPISDPCVRLLHTWKTMSPQDVRSSQFSNALTF